MRWLLCKSTAEIMSNEYLQHHGILGQKWGIRRYQNTDGSLTSSGKKRYQNEDGSYNTNTLIGKYKNGNQKAKWKLNTRVETVTNNKMGDTMASFKTSYTYI